MAKDKILVAVSGGVDSMVMLHKLLALYGAECMGVAHCNFQLRRHESYADEAFVRAAAEGSGVRYHTELFETESYAKSMGLGIQEAARDLRYAYFDELRREFGYLKIATAHHKDDSIETFLINLIRGTGPAGLTGIHDDPTRHIIRPLIEMDRAQIKDYARSHGVHWREDASNKSDKYLRNRIRRELVPLLLDMRPGMKKALRRNMDIQSELSFLLSEQVDSYKSTQVSETEGIIRVRTDKRAGEALILGEILRPYGFNRSQMLDILIGQESGRQIHSSDFVITSQRDVLELKKRKEVESGPWQIQEDLCAGHLPFNLQVECVESAPVSYGSPEKMAFVDMALIEFPLTVRIWRAGDRFIPLGMRGQKKVSDLLNENGLSVEEKKEVYVLENGPDIVWVIGHRINDRYKISENSKEVLKMYI